MSGAEIEREWQLFKRVIPAMQSAEVDPYSLPKLPGYGRTAYFYRKMALSFFRDARQFEWFPGQRRTHLNLAKMYLRTYRELKAEGRVV